MDLIVMGSDGLSAIAHMLLGSVADKVLRMAPCPVLTVRGPVKKEQPHISQMGGVFLTRSN